VLLDVAVDGDAGLDRRCIDLHTNVDDRAARQPFKVLATAVRLLVGWAIFGIAYEISPCHQSKTSS
jgi:hypothetical protein